MSTISLSSTTAPSRSKLFLQGAIAMLPLSIAVIPWGLLAGSYAVESGLTIIESQALSAILFAGSAQLVATGMIKAGASLTTLLSKINRNKIEPLYVLSFHHLPCLCISIKYAQIF